LPERDRWMQGNSWLYCGRKVCSPDFFLVFTETWCFFFAAAFASASVTNEGLEPLTLPAGEHLSAGAGEQSSDSSSDSEFKDEPDFAEELDEENSESGESRPSSLYSIF
tara:strand:- start:479 stop:805 length:327 start_codon:yes stop_codon:yes gene_type:complete